MGSVHRWLRYTHRSDLSFAMHDAVVYISHHTKETILHPAAGMEWQARLRQLVEGDLPQAALGFSS